MTTSKRLKKKVRTIMTERGVNYTTALRLMLEDQQAKREHEAKSAEPKTYLGVRIHAGEDEG